MTSRRLALVRDEQHPFMVRATRTVGETVRLGVGMTAVGLFAFVGILHLVGWLPPSWHVGSSVLALVALTAVLGWQDDD